MAIHVHDEIVHVDVVHSTNEQNFIVYLEIFLTNGFTFIATASKAPSVG